MDKEGDRWLIEMVKRDRHASGHSPHHCLLIKKTGIAGELKFSAKVLSNYLADIVKPFIVVCLLFYGPG